MINKEKTINLNINNIINIEELAKLRKNVSNKVGKSMLLMSDRSNSNFSFCFIEVVLLNFKLN